MTKSAVVGVGYSKILREKGIDGRTLAVEASRRAIADAGLTVRDVDAVFGPSGLAAALGAHMAVVSKACEAALCGGSVPQCGSLVLTV
jgi:3-oxoacyl-[acyl-carrier-protein] synthase III